MNFLSFVVGAYGEAPGAPKAIALPPAAATTPVLTLLLQDVGLIVDGVDDGDKAVRLVAQQAYDLVLMDMQMPVMDGLEATRATRGLTAGERLPIVAITANAFAEDRHRCLAAGMNDITTKPVVPEVLFGTILKQLNLFRSRRTGGTYLTEIYCHSDRQSDPRQESCPG